MILLKKIAELALNNNHSLDILYGNLIRSLFTQLIIDNKMRGKKAPTQWKTGYRETHMLHNIFQMFGIILFLNEH